MRIYTGSCHCTHYRLLIVIELFHQYLKLFFIIVTAAAISFVLNTGYYIYIYISAYNFDMNVRLALFTVCFRLNIFLLSRQ